MSNKTSRTVGHSDQSPSIEKELDKTVAGNNWKELAPSEIGTGVFTEIVTLVLPCYMGQKELELTFAALANQTYPQHLLEVLVIDDGSEPAIKLPAGAAFNASVVAQERNGFGLARARNLGAKHATGKILVFLDCDMIPETQLVEAHARWHQVNKFSLTLGFRHHADFSEVSLQDMFEGIEPKVLVAGKRVTSPQWIEFHMKRTKNLTSNDTDLFRIATGGNLGIRKSFFEKVGGFDSTFQQWGGEDIEFGYRAFNSGGILIPERLATAWHQGAGASPDTSEEASLVQQRHRLSHLIAESGFRRSSPGRSFEIPTLTVSVDADEQTFEEVALQIDGILSSNFHDLVIGLKISDDHPEKVNLERQYGFDPRVQVSQNILKDIPHAALRLEIPPKLTLTPTAVDYLIKSLEKCGVSSVNFEKHGEVRIAKNRALRRAEQVTELNTWKIAGLLFEENILEEALFSSQISNVKNFAPVAPSLNPPFWSLLRKVVKKILVVKSFSDGIDLVKWLFRGLVNVIRRSKVPKLSGEFKSDLSPFRAPSLLRVIGEKSYFPDAQRWSGNSKGVEVVLVTPEASKNFDIQKARPVFLGEANDLPLVPPFDVRYFNPVGFRPVNSKAEVIPIPDFDNKSEDLLMKVRSALAVEHEKIDSIDTALKIIELAATGAPIVIKDKENMVSWLGSELAEAICSVDETKLSDPTEREKMSVNIRRAALKNHTLPVRLEQIRKTAGLTVFKAPPVSVVVATNRPDMLSRIIEIVESQDYDNLELILALHGKNFDRAQTPIPQNKLPITVLHFPKETVFGDVLTEASAVSGGSWVTKMDDDDWYGKEHVSDLFLASQYAHADLVGKGSEFVYLESEGLTVRRDMGNSEVHSRTLAGGTLFVRSELLKEVNGWRSISKKVDVGLIDDVISVGGRVYRTHPFGYLLRRTANNHTWEVNDRYFLRDADQTWDGAAFKVAEVIE